MNKSDSYYSSADMTPLIQSGRQKWKCSGFDTLQYTDGCIGIEHYSVRAGVTDTRIGMRIGTKPYLAHAVN